MFDRTDKLVEATMLALQGKLELKENKKSNRRAKAKKAESIDVNVDETTAVSVDNGTTVVETEDATIMITEPEKQPEESIEAPADLPIETPETVEVPADDTIMPEEILDEPVDTELPEKEDDEPSIDEMVEESKKVTETKSDNEVEGELEDLLLHKRFVDLKDVEKYLEDNGIKISSHFAKDGSDMGEPDPDFTPDDCYIGNIVVDGLGYDVEFYVLTTNENKLYITEVTVLEQYDESKKVENVEIEVSDDGKEIEVTTDDHEEVEVKDETSEETDDEEEISAPEDGNENIDGEEIIDDELVDECKKITESDDYGSALYGPKYIASVTTEVAQNIDSLNNDTKYQDAIKDEDKLNLVVDSIMDDDELWNTLQETIVYYIDELIAGNLNESKKIEKVNKNNAEINNAIANPQLKANREKIRKAGYETDKKSVTNPRNGRTFQTKYAPNKDKIDWKNRLDKDKTDYEAIVGPESDKIPNSRKINQKSTTATYSKADADAYGVKYGPKDECDRVVEDTDYALEPRYDSRNSFYGKARVVTKDNGDEELYSYGTHVAGVRGGKPYSKGRFSATTSRHQNEFFKQRNIDPKKVDVEEGKSCKNCDEKLEAFKAKSRANRKAKLEAMKTKKTENINDDLGIEEGVPKKEEIVPNAQKTTVKNGKVSSKSFTEALTKFFKENYKTIKEVNVSKISQNKSGDLKIEAVIKNLGNKTKDICLEMTKVQSGKSFNKYTLKEAKGLIKESKNDNKKITMMTFNNKNIMECRYLLKK